MNIDPRGNGDNRGITKNLGETLPALLFCPPRISLEFTRARSL